MNTASYEKRILCELAATSLINSALTPAPSEADPKEPIVYDYMKYNINKKKHKGGQTKKTKCVSFKRIVEMVTFTDDWKMHATEGNLRTEEEQRLSSNLRRNF